MPDVAASIYASQGLHQALSSDCSSGRESARHALAMDKSMATAPGAALALALCGEGAKPLQDLQLLSSRSPSNAMLRDVYVPEVKAGMALAQHHPESVAEILAPAASYGLSSKAAQLRGLASLAAKRPQQAISDFETGIRYRGLSLGEGGGGTAQSPDYALCLLGTARAQAQIDKTAALKSYQKLLDLWKDADSDFIPAQEARAEMTALSR